MSDLHKSDPYSPYADDLEFVRDYARRNDGYSLVQPVVDFINAHPDPQIIRTVEELEALDPHMVVIDRYDVYTAREYIDADRHGQKGYEHDLPAVAVDARACREALEGETT